MPILTENDNPVGASQPGWNTLLKKAYRQPRELLEQLKLPLSLLDGIEKSQNQFPLFCPEPFLERMECGNPDDPLFRQVWPAKDESDSLELNRNPLQEDQFQIQPGLLRKYASRVLLVLTGVCAIHCRYCFRRFFPYEATPKSIENWGPALQTIESDSSIREVIFSGGDPLMVVDETLDQLLDRLDRIPHVKRIRFHSRLPIVLPQRVTRSLVKTFENRESKIVFVLHANHAQEIDSRVSEAIQCLRRPGHLILNQAVLLRGINDTAEQLTELSESLIQTGVLPYYLHQLDPVAGSQHFEVDDDRAIQIVQEMRDSASGYMVPRLVRETPGETGKTVLR